MIKKSSNNRNDDFSRSAAPKSPVFSIIMPLSWRIHAWLVRLKGSLICVKNVLLIVLLIVSQLNYETMSNTFFTKEK